MAPKRKIKIKICKVTQNIKRYPSVKIIYMLNAQVQKNSQNTNKEKQNLFANFVLTAPVLNVTGMSSMTRKEIFVLVVVFGYIKNVQELPKLNTKILETIRKNLCTADLLKPTWFLFTA